MAIKGNLQLSQLEHLPREKTRAMKNVEGIAALSRLVNYCEAEASDLKLSFVAYCLSIAKVALAEESGSDMLELTDRGQSEAS